MKRFAFSSLAVALLAALSWILFLHPDRGDDGRQVDQNAHAARAPAASDPMAALEDSELTPLASEASRSTVDPEATMGRILTVRVVKESGGAGVPGIPVRLVDWDAPENAGLLALWRDTLRDRETDALDYGTIAVSDADGRVRFPRPERGSLSARAGEYYADEAVYDRAPDELELLLERELDVRALVLDVDGRPVGGVPVAWMVWSGDSARMRIQARSGEDGIARVRHLQSRLPGDPGGRNVLLLALPGGVEGQVPFEPENPPTEPIELRLPPFGSVEVIVLDADGQSFPDGTKVILQAALDDREKAKYWDYSPNPHDEKGRSTAWTQGGSARFEHVGIGQRLEALAYHNEMREYFAVEDDGLRASGKHRQIVLRLAEAPTVLTARLLRPDGSAIANASVASRLCFDGGSSGRTLATDDKGRFRHFLNEEEYPADPDRKWWLAHRDDGTADIIIARVPLPLPLDVGDQSLGDIVLGTGGVLAEGRVVDEDGEPVAGVRLGLSPADGSGSDHLDLPRGKLGTKDLSDENGGFSFTGADAAAGWILSFEKQGWHRQRLEVSSGAQGLVIALQREERRTLGKILLDESVPRDLLLLRWKPREASTTNPVLTLAADGSIHCDAAVSGIGELQLVSSRVGETLVSIPDLSLDGGSGPLAELDPLDLRGRVFFHQVLVSGPGAQPPGRLSVDFGLTPPRVHTGWSNPLRFLTSDRDRVITIYAPGAAANSLRLPDGATELRVEAGRPVSWELLGDEWQSSGATITITPAFTTGGALDGFPCTLDASGRGSGFLPGAGTYRLHLEYAFEIDGRVRMSNTDNGALTLTGESEFVIAAGTEPLLIQFRLRERAAANARGWLSNEF